MKTVLKKIVPMILVAVWVVLPMHTYAVVEQCDADDKSLVFLNGVNTTRSEAKLNNMILAKAVRDLADPEVYEKITFDLAYNTTVNLVYDVYEGLKQLNYSDNRSYWLARADNTPSEFERNYFLDRVSSLDKHQLLAYQDLSEHMALYRGRLAEGKTVTIVSHSQGNFFANAAVNNMDFFEKRSVAIIAVATPDSYLAENSTWVTLNQDAIIKKVRIAAQVLGLDEPLPAHYQSHPDITDTAYYHNFIFAYMVPKSLPRLEIASDALFFSQYLVRPQILVSSGPVAASLIWDYGQDVDLHVYEPDDSHVYYANLQGTTGVLDRDDADAPGLEHYVVCDKPALGQYRFGVNYFAGSAAVVATIVIKGGLNIKTGSLLLLVPRGNTGDDDPIPLGTVTVTQERVDEYKFVIE